MSSETNKLILKANLPRTRDLSFVGRFHHNFGFEDDLFEYLLDQKDMWGDRLFYMNEKQFRKWIEEERHMIREIPVFRGFPPFPDMELTSLSEQEFDKSFGSLEPVDLKISKGGRAAHHQLAKGDCISLKEAIDRNGLALNVGGYVTAMKWLPYSSSSLLAVFIINNKDGLRASVSEPELSVFAGRSHGENVRSALQLWKYDVEKSTLTLSQVLDTSRFGVSSNIKWLPVKYSNDNEGILSGVFTDGKVHFFSIKDQTSARTVYSLVAKPSWSISLTDERRKEPSLLPITAYDILDHTKVLVGALDGSVAEFLLPSPAAADDDLSIPSFVTYITNSMITSICIAEVKTSNIVLINTATTSNFALQYDQLRQGRVETGFTISTLQPLYHRAYRIFIYPDSAESIGYTFVRHPQQKHSLLLKTELISTFHISEFLNHPFAVVGNSCGDVFVMNIGRKIFGVPKAHNKLVVPLKIWSLFRAPGETGLTLLGDYIPVAPDRGEIMYTFTPPEVVISAAAWNENLSGSSAYAFGTYNGLLVLERLDPVLI